MGRTNQQTWKQPPASVNVEWPTDRTSMSGPTFEEQKARMRETRVNVANVIAAAGYPVPKWPEVGEQVNWNSPQHAPLGQGLAGLNSGTGRHTSRLSSSRIPLRYQTPAPGANIQAHRRLEKGVSPPPLRSLQCSPLPRVPTRPRSKTQQSEELNLIETLMGFVRLREEYHKPLGWKPSQAQDDLPSDIDPSILNPRVLVVELPDHIFQCTSPTAPQAMLGQFSSLGGPQKSGRARRVSEATAASQRTCESTGSRARGYFPATTGSDHSLEPVLPDCDHYTEPGEGSETATAHLTAVDAVAGHGIHQPCSLGPPPGFEYHQISRPTREIPPPPGFEDFSSGVDAPTCRWSLSKIWVSEEERLRIDFARLQDRAHQAGLDKSPFLPQTVADYAILLAEDNASEADHMRKRIHDSEEDVQNRYDEVERHTIMPPGQQFELFWGRKMNDGLSSVLAMESCFNEMPDAPENERVDWPPSPEFRSWKASRPPPGTRWRSDSHRGAWPFPRMNVPFRADETFDDGEIPYSRRKMVFAPRWDWAPKFVKMKDDESHLPAPEISMKQISVNNPLLADLIREIQRESDQEPSDD